MNKDLIINTYEDNILLFKENLLGTLEKNILKYENETDTFLIDLDNAKLTKENLESILSINKEYANLSLKEIDYTLNINVNKYLFSNHNNKITIEYLLESQEKPIKIEIEMSDINA